MFKAIHFSWNLASPKDFRKLCLSLYDLASTFHFVQVFSRIPKFNIKHKTQTSSPIAFFITGQYEFAKPSFPFITCTNLQINYRPAQNYTRHQIPTIKVILINYKRFHQIIYKILKANNNIKSNKVYHTIKNVLRC